MNRYGARQVLWRIQARDLAPTATGGTLQQAYLELMQAKYFGKDRLCATRARGSGGIDEATFCQKLKSRIKEEYIPGIDRLVVTRNKGDGYRLRAQAEEGR